MSSMVFNDLLRHADTSANGYAPVSDLSAVCAKIGKRLAALIGQPCSKAEFSYGREFMFHFGPLVPYDHPLQEGQTQGTWILGTRASGWRLLAPGARKLIEVDWPAELLSGATFKWGRRETADEAEVEAAVQHDLVGASVIHVQLLPLAFGFGLMLTFDNGASLALSPSPERDDDPEPIADWELFFTAEHTYLRCGPDRQCAYLRADKVEDEDAEEDDH